MDIGAWWLVVAIVLCLLLPVGRGTARTANSLKTTLAIVVTITENTSKAPLVRMVHRPFPARSVTLDSPRAVRRAFPRPVAPCARPGEGPPREG